MGFQIGVIPDQMLMVPKIKELGDITRVDIILGDGGCQETSEWTGQVLWVFQSAGISR